MSDLFNKCDELLLDVMISMAMSDSELDANETSEIRSIFERLSGVELAEKHMLAKLDAFDRDSDKTLDRLSAECASLSNAEKEKIISGAYLVLLADGVIAAQEKSALHKIADAMKMPEIHYKAILETLSS